MFATPDRVGCRRAPLAGTHRGRSGTLSGFRATIVGRRCIEGRKVRSIGRYVLRERIGRGGMGEVYRALDPQLPRRRVAIKTLSSLAPADLARFQREAEAISMASMSSRHIVKIFEFGEVDGAPFIVMELLQGEDLETLILKGPLEITRAVDIILGVCSGAWACHRRGILHRDLKPRNIFLHEEDEGEVVKILDFGVSTFPFAKEVTGPYQVMGTVRYMAPEQLAGAGIDERSDLYAIGVLLYQCLTGRLPFEGKGDRERIDKILLGRFQSAIEHRSEIPAALDAIVRRAISRDPEARFQTARDFGQALIPFANAARQILFTENFHGPVRPVVEPMSRAVGSDAFSAPSSASNRLASGTSGGATEVNPVVPTAGYQPTKPPSGAVPLGPLVETSTPLARPPRKGDADRTEPEHERSTVRYEPPTVAVQLTPSGQVVRPPAAASRAAEPPATYEAGGTRAVEPRAPLQEERTVGAPRGRVLTSRRTWLIGASVLLVGGTVTVAGALNMRGAGQHHLAVSYDSAQPTAADAGVSDAVGASPPASDARDAGASVDARRRIRHPVRERTPSEPVPDRPIPNEKPAPIIPN
jgi:serine/threonine protein kinase